MASLLDWYPEEEGTLLDLAFRDRWQMWSDYAEATGSGIAQQDTGNGWEERLFEHDGKIFYEPGEAPLIDGRDPDDPSSYDYQAPKQASGPDGKGEDALIKNPDELISSLVDVVEKLGVLEAFRWDSPVMPMPVGVLDVLEKLTTLKTLHVDVRLVRNNVHAGEQKKHSPQIRLADLILCVQFPTGSSSRTSSLSPSSKSTKGTTSTRSPVRSRRQAWHRTSCPIGCPWVSISTSSRTETASTAPSLRVPSLLQPGLAS